jgi:hypothetical protein
MGIVASLMALSFRDQVFQFIRAAIQCLLYYLSFLFKVLPLAVLLYQHRGVCGQLLDHSGFFFNRINCHLEHLLFPASQGYSLTKQQ